MVSGFERFMSEAFADDHSTLVCERVRSSLL